MLLLPQLLKMTCLEFPGPNKLQHFAQFQVTPEANVITAATRKMTCLEFHGPNNLQHFDQFQVTPEVEASGVL